MSATLDNEENDASTDNQENENVLDLTTAGTNSLARTSLSDKEQNLSTLSRGSSGSRSNLKKIVSFATNIDSKISSKGSEEILQHNYVFTEESHQGTTNNSRSVSREIKTSHDKISSGSGFLEKISEVDEESESESTPGYYGWDGYETRFPDDLRDDLSQEDIPKCIPPWAKTIRRNYGLISPSASMNEEAQSSMQERIENLMKKHSELMLVKRVENRKQLTLEPGKCDSDIDVVKMRAKNTRYYMAPLTKSDERKFAKKSETDSNTKEHRPSGTRSSVSESETDDNRISISKKTSRLQAKRELSNVLRTLYKNVPKKQEEIQTHDASVKKEPSVKCPKITLSKIREYVNAQAMDPDERKLHEIIKVEKVPSLSEQQRGKPGSKYVINVPQSKNNDQATINIIKIKEKRKLRVHSVEDIEEKTTELQYDQGARSYRRGGRNQNAKLENQTEHVKKKVKSPTETKTFEVTSKTIPRISPLVDQNEKKEKVLLMQYEKKSKSGKKKCREHTTHLLGIKEPGSDDPGEMYLYDSEAEEGRVREKVTKVDDIPPTLKDKVNLIFQELRDLTFKKPDVKTSEIQVRPSITSKTTQHFSQMLVEREVQIMPEVRSAEVQVRQSQFSIPETSLQAPPLTPVSGVISGSITVQDEEKQIDNEVEKMRTITRESFSKTEKAKYITSPDTRLEEFQEETSDIEVEGKIIEDAIENEKQVDEDLVETRGKDIHEENLFVGDEPIETKEEEEMSDEETFEAVEEQATKTEVDEIKLKEEESITEETKLQEETSGLQEETKPEELDTIEDTETKSYKIVPKKKTSQTIEPIIIEDKDEKDTLVVYDREERKETEEVSETSDTNKKPDNFTFLEADADIYSYDFDPSQGTEIMYKSPSKFLRDKASVRKMLNWTDDTLYLEKVLPSLIRGLAETALRRPADPVSFLAHWIYRTRLNQQKEEEELVQEEHRLVARDMMHLGEGDTLPRKKFSVRKYPVNKENEKESEETAQNSDQENEKESEETTQISDQESRPSEIPQDD